MSRLLTFLRDEILSQEEWETYEELLAGAVKDKNEKYFSEVVQFFDP